MAIKTQGTQLYYLSAPDTVTRVGKLTGVTGTGGANDQIDITDLDSVEKEYLAGLPNPGAASVPINFDPSNEDHQALYALWQSGVTVTWIIGLSDGTAPPTAAAGVITYPATRTYFDFQGYIADFPIDAAVNSKVETTMTVQRSGPKNPHWKA
jgi:hypothetical protein